MKFIVGTKEHMTQLFDDAGNVHPATVIRVSRMVVTQVKTSEKDGYNAIQFGIGVQQERRITKPLKGHTKDLGTFRHIKEYRPNEDERFEMKEGDTLDVATFTEGDVVRVTGNSKGKGFQGVVKRHGFHGGSRTHGQKHSEREPGSIGATGPQRVFKGTKMGGRMGNDRVTVSNLKVLRVDAKNNEVWISGAVPGRRGTVVEVRGK